MLKKIFKIFTIVFSTIIALLLIASGIVWTNRAKILTHFTTEAQKKLNTDIHLESMDVSLLEHFPNITIDINKIFIREAIAGSSDTLLYANRLELSFSISDILNEQYRLKHIYLLDGQVKLFWDEKGNNNFTILDTPTDSTDTTSSTLEFELEKIVVERSQLVFDHRKIDNYHRGFFQQMEAHLNWSDHTLTLSTTGDIDIYQLGFGNDSYFKNKSVHLDTELSYETEKKNFKINEGDIALENADFEISGGLNTADQSYIDLSIKADKSDIQAILSILPQRIYKPLSNYKSKGEVYFNGHVTGAIAENISPQIDVNFGFENATFYHPESQQEITQAYLKGKYSNGKKHNLSTSYIELKDFKGNLSDHEIAGNFLYKNFEDPYIEFFVNGAFDATKLFSFIPESGITPTSGSLSLNLYFSGMQKHLQEPAGAQHLTTSGQLFISDFTFNISENDLDFRDFNGSFLFDKNDLIINGFHGEIGQSDFDLSGFFHNVISYALLEDQTLGIAAEFSSSYLNLDELFSQKSENNSTSQSVKKPELRIPPSLAFQFNCAIDSLKFQNLSGKDIARDLEGSVDLQYQSILFKDLSMSTSGGKINLTNGFLEAKDHKDIFFQTSGTLHNIDVERALKIVNDLDQTFITHKNLKGDLSGKVDLSFEMNHGLDVKTETVHADLDLQVDNGKLKDFEPMIELGLFLKQKKFKRYLKDDRFSDISFSQLKETIEIHDSKIKIPFMEIKSSITDMTILGNHGFDGKFNYDISFPLINYDRRERLEQRGVIQNKKNEIEVHLNIAGNNDDYEVDFLGKETTKSFFKVAQDQFEEDAPAPEVGIDTTQELTEEEEDAFNDFFDD